MVAEREKAITMETRDAIVLTFGTNVMYLSF